MENAISFSVKKVSEYRKYLTEKTIAIYLNEMQMKPDSPWLPTVVNELVHTFPDALVVVDPLKTYIYMEWR
jgi:hypothetical protein